MRIPSGVTDQYIYFVAVDATDFTTRETGLSSFTVYRSRNGAAAAAMTTPTINETSSANMPGVYELLLDEDMTIGAGNDSEEMVFHITATGMAPVTRTIELYRPKITAGNTLGVAADGDISGNLDGTVATVTTLTGHTAQTGDSFARIGANGGGLSAIPWNASWDAEVQSEVNDGLVAYDAATGADITALNDLSAADVNAQVDTALADIRLDELMFSALGSQPTAGSMFGDLTEDDAGTQRFTTNALENAPSGAGSSDWTATEREQIRFRLALDGTQTNPTTGTGTIEDILADTNELQTDNVPGLISALNDISTAEVNTQVDTALSDIGLDHLLSAAVVGTDVTNNSVVARLVSSSATADWDSYDNTSDSLQAIRDRGDAAWTTGGGGSLTQAINVQPMIPGAIDLANTATYRMGLLIVNSVDDLPSTAEITPGTIDIDRKAKGATSWTTVVNGAACSEAAGLIYYDEVFDSGTGYAEGDMIRITFFSQSVTADANTHEISDGTQGRTFYTGIMVATPAVNVTQIEGLDATDQINAACDTAISDASLATAASIAALNDVSTAEVNAQCDLAISDAALATAASIAALNDLSTAQVNAEVDTALSDIFLDQLFAADYNPATPPGVSTALLNELIESDAGVSRFTANALEQSSIGDGSGLTNIPWNASWDAEVQSECTDALNAYDPPTRAELTSDINSLNDITVADILAGTITELSSIPAASPTLAQAISLLYMALRNRRDTTATTDEIHNDVGTVIGTATVSDDTVTFTKGEYS